MNSEGHLTDAALRALVLREAECTPETGAHFFVCEACQKRALARHPKQGRALLNLLEPLQAALRPVLSSGSTEALSHALAAVQQERERADSLIQQIASGTELGTSAVAVDSLVLANAALSWAKNARQGNPKDILRVCEAALGRLRTPESHGVYSDAILAASAMLRAELGNAYRILGEFPKARSELQEALSGYEQFADEHARANVLHLAAVYSKDVKDLRCAEVLGTKALRSFQRIGEAQGAERAARLLATVPFEQGDFATAKASFSKILEMGPTDRAVELSAVYHLVKMEALEGAGFHTGRWLTRLRQLSSEWPEKRVKVTLAWLRALVLGNVGRPDRAVELLEGVRSFYLELEALYDVGLVGVDLAFMLLRTGRNLEAAKMASEAAWALTASLPDNPKIGAAIRAFEEATREGRVTQMVYRGTVLQVLRGRTCPRSPNLLALQDVTHGS